MRISDWSSDVCSSDLGGGLARRQGFGTAGIMVAQLTGRTQASALRSIDAGKAFTAQDVPANASPAESSNDADMAGGSETAGGSDTAPTPTPGPRYPAVAGAALAGQLSVDAAGLITAGLESLTDRVPSEELHDLERRLVAKA